MLNYMAGAFVVFAGLLIIGLQIHRNGQGAVSDAWSVVRVSTEIEYTSQSKALRGYVIGYREHVPSPFIAKKWTDGSLVLHEHFTTFAEAEKAVMKHAGLILSGVSKNEDWEEAD
jgi:hypothetical protein